MGWFLSPLRHRGCWHVWVCRMGIAGCSCGPHHCSLCGLRWRDRGYDDEGRP